MQELFEIINRKVDELNGLLPMKAEFTQRLEEKIRLEFNFNSNHIEGNTLTYGETRLLLIFDRTTGNHDMREYEEMKAHDVAYELVKQQALDERPLTEAFIKNLHKTLLVRPFWKEAITADGQQTRRQIEIGDYKKFPNSVRLKNGEIFHYASVEETPIRMGELIQWLREAEREPTGHPVELAALLHYRFVRIHPFDDGNGRLARLLMNYVLLKCNFPPVIIRSSDKESYLFALNQADAGDLQKFVVYIGEQMIKSLELSIKAAHGEDIEEPDDWEKELELLKRRGSNNTELLTRSANTILSTLETFAFPLISKVDQKLSKFGELFAERQVFAGNEQSQSEIFSTSEVNSLIGESVVPYMNAFQCRFRFNGYKMDGTNTFSINILLAWRFEDFTYYFFLDDINNYSNARKYLYGSTISEDEISRIANDAGRILLLKLNANRKS